jgi:hypothetical protein
MGGPNYKFNHPARGNELHGADTLYNRELLGMQW